MTMAMNTNIKMLFTYLTLASHSLSVNSTRQYPPSTETKDSNLAVGTLWLNVFEKLGFKFINDPTSVNESKNTGFKKESRSQKTNIGINPPACICS